MDFEVGNRVQIKYETFSDTYKFLNRAYGIIDAIDIDLKLIHLNNFQDQEGNLMPIPAEAEGYLSRKGLWVGFSNVIKQNLSYPEFSQSAWDDVMEVI